jgi:molybdate transport system substrate-binding protein
MKIVMTALAMTLAISAQAQQPSPQKPILQQPIRIYAAASLKPALNEVAAAYPAAKVEVVYGASGQLRERIAKGDRAEVFASADMDHAYSLVKQGLSGPVKRFARSELCALASPQVALTTENFLERLLDPAVTLGGDNARPLFEKAERVRPGAQAVLEKKALKRAGGADIFLASCAGALEARSGNGALQVVQLPEELATAANFGLTLVQGSRDEAWHFTQFVLSPTGQAILSKHGFAAGAALK